MAEHHDHEAEPSHRVDNPVAMLRGILGHPADVGQQFHSIVTVGHQLRIRRLLGLGIRRCHIACRVG